MRKVISSITPQWMKQFVRGGADWGSRHGQSVKRWYRRLLHDPASRNQFLAAPPKLTDPQGRAAEELSARGIALVHFDELAGEAGTWAEYRALMDAFEASDQVQEAVRAFRDRFANPTSKNTYQVTLRPDGATVPADDPWLLLGLRPFVLDVVNTYLGLWSRLNYVNVWYTIPIEAERPRAFSQNWHRDPEDTRMVKVFLYCNDIDESAGPFEYVPGSSLSGRHRHLWPYGYPPEGAIEKQFRPEERLTCTCPAGTFVFCDTTGFHRGGFALKSPRRVATWAYVRPSSWWQRRYVLGQSNEPPVLSSAARFALE
jgi:hypothetical protein